MKYVYCSGPLFCAEEIAAMTAISNVLEDAGFGTFLPHRDGVERYVMGLVNTPLNTNLLGLRDRADRAIFALDVFQIVTRCDYFVFNMNGRVPDEGGLVETGVAFSVGKPVVLYKNDRRSVFGGSDNSMVLGLSILPPVSDIGKLPAEILRAEKKMEEVGSPGRPHLSGSLEKTVRQGEKVWNLLSSLPVKRPGKKGTDDFVKKIMEICGHPLGPDHS